MPENAHEGITIEFRGDSVSFDNTVNAMNHAIRALRKDISGFNKELKFNPNNLEVLKKEFQDYNNAITATNAKLQYLRRDLADCVDENGKVTDEKKWLRLQAEITDTTGELMKLEDAAKKVKLRIDNIDAYRMADSFEQLGKTLNNAGRNLENIGRTLMPISTVAAAGLGGAAKAAMDFESALTGVYKTVDETPTTTYEDIEKWIRTMATELPATASEIANVAEVAGQLGITADSLQPFVRTMIDLGNATNITATEGAAAVAQFFNIMGYSANDVKEDVDNFGAALTALGNNAATDEESIVYMAKALAAAGHQIGLSTQEVLGLSTTLSSLGLSAERGGSAMSTIFRKIETDAKTFSDAGSERLAAWGELLGMTGEQFRKAWNEDTINTIEKIIIGLGQTEEISKSLYEVLDDVDVSNIRQIDTITRLANSEGMLSKYIAMANEEWSKNSALTIEAERRYNTTASQLQILKNNAIEVGISLGETLLPIINDLIDSLKPFVESLRDYVRENGKAVTSALALVSALAPTLLIVGKGMKLFGGLSTAVAKYTKLGIEAEGATQMLAKVLGAGSKLGLGVAIGATVIGLGALAVAIIRSRDETLKFKKEVDSLNTTLEKSVQFADDEYQSRISEAEGAMYYAKRLDELIYKVGTANLTEEEYLQTKSDIQTMIDSLNGALGESIYSWDAETNTLLKSGEAADSAAESYRNLLAEMRRTAWLETHQQALQESWQMEEEAWGLSSRAIDEYTSRIETLEGKYASLGIPPEVMTSIQQFTSNMGGSIEDILGVLSQNDQFMQQFNGDLGAMYDAVSPLIAGMVSAYDDYNVKLAESNGLMENARSIQEQYDAVLNSTAETFPGIIAQQNASNEAEDASIEKLRIRKQLLEEQQAALVASGQGESEYINAQLALVDEQIGKEQERKQARMDATTEATDFEKMRSDEADRYLENSNTNMNSTLLTNNRRTWDETGVYANNIADQIRAYFNAMTFDEKTLAVNVELRGDGAQYINGGTVRSYGYAGQRSGGFNNGYRSGGFNVTFSPTFNVSGGLSGANAKRFADQMVDYLNVELGKRLRLNG